MRTPEPRPLLYLHVPAAIVEENTLIFFTGRLVSDLQQFGVEGWRKSEQGGGNKSVSTYLSAQDNGF